jgi:hypothetical protein
MQTLTCPVDLAVIKLNTVTINKYIILSKLKHNITLSKFALKDWKYLQSVSRKQSHKLIPWYRSFWSRYSINNNNCVFRVIYKIDDFISAMERIFSLGKKWTVPFNSDLPCWMEIFHLMKIFLPLNSWTFINCILAHVLNIFFVFIQRSVLTKLDTLIEKHDETLSILRVLSSATRGVNDKELLDDILPSPLDTVEEITEFYSRLDDEEFRKKMVVSSTKT